MYKCILAKLNYSIFAVATQHNCIKYLYLAAFYPFQYLFLLDFVSE